MPSAPNADAPATVWAGGQDAAIVAAAEGNAWLAPIFALGKPRIIDIPTLCAGPPPSAAPFTTVDLLASFQGPEAHAGVIAKIEANTDIIMWERFCHYTDATPAPPPPDFTPPADLPDGPMPASEADAHRKMLRMLSYIQDSSIGRLYKPGAAHECTGEGAFGILPNPEPDTMPWAAGVSIEVVAKPVYAASSGGTENSMWFDLGWVSVSSGGYNLPPVRLNRLSTIIYPIWPNVHGFTYSLPDGVTILVAPLYPKGGVGSIGE